MFPRWKWRICYSHSVKGAWNESLNFIFPRKYVIPKSLKVGLWLCERLKCTHPGAAPPQRMVTSLYLRLTAFSFRTTAFSVESSSNFSCRQSISGLQSFKKRTEKSWDTNKPLWAAINNRSRVTCKQLTDEETDRKVLRHQQAFMSSDQ